MRKIVVPSLLALLVSSSPAMAEDLAAQLAKCAQNSDSLQRLICYDDLAKNSGGKVAPVSAKNTEQSNSAKVSTVAVAATKPATREQEFGSEAIKKPKDENEIQEVVFTIASLTKNLHKQWRITFENGQVWQQIESGRGVKLSKGDKVKIQRGMLGSYLMKKLDANREIRVKRIK